MTTKKMGIKETTEMVEFIATLVGGIGRSLEDGEITWWDARHFIEAFSRAGDAVADCGLILPELADLDDAERKKLIEIFAAETEIPQKWAESVIKWAFEIGINLTKIIEFIRARQSELT